MTIHEVTSAFLSTIPPQPQPHRPPHISDLEFAEIFKAFLKSLKAMREEEAARKARRYYLDDLKAMLAERRRHQDEENTG